MSVIVNWQDILEHTKAVVPNFEKLAAHEQVGKLFICGETLLGLPEVLADLIPEQREFWMRVQAEIEHCYRGFLVAIFSPEFGDSETNQTMDSGDNGNS